MAPAWHNRHSDTLPALCKPENHASQCKPSATSLVSAAPLRFGTGELAFGDVGLELVVVVGMLATSLMTLEKEAQHTRTRSDDSGSSAWFCCKET